MVALTMITILDICMISLLFLYIGLIFSDIINEIFFMIDGTENPEELSTIFLFFSASAQFCFVAISAYIIRNIVSSIPNPFNYVYDYSRTKDVFPELNGGVVVSFVLLLFQSSLKEKLYIIRKRLKIY
ncbi:hypothetical protein Catovirus_1_362 [Catovirus CTV1]|uniref:Uncharacterized protein n=1 Tax=Catovirus CTV1 TaxID=1977631 RepID=A0A1V0S9D5_9VIRU|nr:hypothetical protein Catovirus_1_362 [Catovirus CTV1]